MELKNSLVYFLRHIIDISGAEAVGFRLHKNGDFPFYIYDGFSKEFIENENSLFARDKNNRFITSPKSKNFHLECMCGNIIMGRFNPSLPFFTENGSFFSNSLSYLLSTTTEKERQGWTRNYCNSVGYMSLAIVPIRINGKVIGVIHVADKRKNLFSKESIKHLEVISEDISYEITSNLKYIKIRKVNNNINLLNKKYRKLANTDSLTGLLNRRAFLLALFSERKRSKRIKEPFTLIMADIDYFKKINDESGHDIGDKVLIKVAKILKKSIREIDIASRWGGDEFLMLLPETPYKGGVLLANKLRLIISSSPLKSVNKNINFTMSWGVSECNSERSCEDFIRDADDSLYKAKHLGRNIVSTKEPDI